MNINLGNKWGGAVGHLIGLAIIAAAVLFSVAIVLSALGAVLLAWHVLMGV